MGDVQGGETITVALDLSIGGSETPITVPTATVPTATVPTATTDLILHAEGPSTIIAGQPFTYTYTITNQGTTEATGVYFEDEVPSDMNLVAYAPGLPPCEQQADLLTCYLHDLDSKETITVTLVITGHGGQPMKLGLDPLAPGWPICTVLKENTWQHILQCELGSLKAGQSTRVQMGLKAIGVRQRTTANTATVGAREVDLVPQDNTITSTMAVRIEADLMLRPTIFGPADAGQAVSYTLTVLNRGPSDADDVVLTDALPPGATLLSAATSRGDECQGQGTASVICDLGRLAGSETATVTVHVVVDRDLVHTARVTAKPVDPNPGNNELTESIPVSSGDSD